MHFRAMFDSDYIGSWDLPAGKDVAATIAGVTLELLTRQGGKKEQKPVMTFDGKKKGMVLNKTNAKTIAALYGPETSDWVGKRILLFATQTTFGSETVDCIRVRPTAPGPAKAAPRKAPTVTDDGEVIEREDASELGEQLEESILAERGKLFQQLLTDLLNSRTPETKEVAMAAIGAAKDKLLPEHLAKLRTAAREMAQGPAVQ